MKVGILTLPLRDNYGGILQAVALSSYLATKGHEVVLIQKSAQPPRGLKASLKSVARELLLKIPLPGLINTPKLLSVRRIRLHRSFIESAFRNISPKVFTTDDLRTYVEREGVEAIIVGSDQVWRKRYIDDPYYLSYFLDFVDGKACRKIAYAASFGKDYWEGTGDSKRIGELLSDFTAVSTREQSGVRICQDTFEYTQAVSVLDPTLLMDQKFYIDKVINGNVSKDYTVNGLLTYVLDEDPEKLAIIRAAMNAIGCEVATHLKGFSSHTRIYTIPEWVASFQRANFVVTDSFHGMLFSIIFEKNFVVIGNSHRGMERFTSILSQIGLENRLILRTDDLSKSQFSQIDYSRVNEALRPLKERSFSFLEKTLKTAPSEVVFSE